MLLKQKLRTKWHFAISSNHIKINDMLAKRFQLIFYSASMICKVFKITCIITSLVSLYVGSQGSGEVKPQRSKCQTSTLHI